MLSISTDKLGYIIIKAEEFDVKVAPDELEEGSNPSDDKDVAILEDAPDDLTEQELRDALEGLNQDELLDLIALTWIGRGDFTAKDWDRARGQAREMRHQHVPSYLMETPLLADYLKEGLSSMGYSSSDVETEHL